MGTIKTTNIETITGSGTLTLGTSGETITIPSGVTLTNNGTASGFGKVLQVVSATDSTSRSTTSTSFVTASNTLSVNITPSSTSNKILVLAQSNTNSSSGAGYQYITLFRDSTNLGDSSNGMNVASNVTGVQTSYTPVSLKFLDSPNTTSAITYQVYFRSNSASYTARINRGQAGGTDTVGSIIAMEIGA